MHPAASYYSKILSLKPKGEEIFFIIIIYLFIYVFFSFVTSVLFVYLPKIFFNSKKWLFCFSRFTRERDSSRSVTSVKTFALRHAFCPASKPSPAACCNSTIIACRWGCFARWLRRASGWSWKNRTRNSSVTNAGRRYYTWFLYILLSVLLHQPPNGNV